jgi:hypothetical protein
MKARNVYLPALLVLLMGQLPAQTLYQKPKGVQSRLSSFENLNGIKGNGGRTNKTAKGNPAENLAPGESKTLLDVKGQGIVQRIWLTIDQNPVKLRSLRLQVFWDGESRAAVDVPLGDFFCYNLGKQVAFESALFSSGEGRSFVSYIPMPFHKAAKITLTNEGKETTTLFFDIDFSYEQVPDDALYFHAHWTRKWTGKPGDDFEILPLVQGKGRFLGMSVGLNTDTAYGKSWWGEGEVKMYMDDDSPFPTINGTGSEDYVGSAWGLGKFINQYQGCTVANDSTGQFNFYRWHIPDAIWFDRNIRVVIQQIGGWMRDDVRRLIQRNARLIPISVSSSQGFRRLLDNPLGITDPSFPNGWVNFYRVDDYSAVAYFYLDKPSNNLESLAPLETRTKNLR